MVAEDSKGTLATCSVVLCTRDRPILLNRCLQAVVRLAYPRFDVLVVDNAPSDPRTREVAARWGVRYVVEPIVGLSRARNRGARACDTDVVAFLDDDALPEPEWLSGLAREFTDPLVMAATGRILPVRVETEVERLSVLVGATVLGGPDRRVLDGQTPAWFELANFGGVGNGGNMAFRRSAFDLWPGFDERLGRGAVLNGCEEHYAFFSLIDRGYRVVYTPDAVVRHPCTRTLEELRARHLKVLATSAGYITFLLAEEPRYRHATLTYIAGALRGTPRPWRGQTDRPRPRIVPGWRLLLVWLSGPLLYVKSRLSHALRSNRS